MALGRNARLRKFATIGLVLHVSGSEILMATIESPPHAPETIADLLRRLGNVSAARVRLQPPPGTASERDVVDTHQRERRLCELVEGALVEKTMGFEESQLTISLIIILGTFVKQHDLGIMAGADGPLRLFPGLVRIPDISFISWDRLPGRKSPKAPIPDLAPDLAVEVLSKGNTKGEMTRKLREYFEAGTRLVWLIDPRARTVRVHEAPRRSVLLGPEDTLDGGDVLPGFALPLRELFPAEGR